MAVKAPKPGQRRHDEAAAAATMTMHVTVHDKVLSFCPNALPFAVRAKIRKSTGGLPFEVFWNGENAVGEDSLMVMLLAARLVNDEAGASIAEIEAEWPDIEAGAFDFTVDEPDAVDVESDPQS